MSYAFKVRIAAASDLREQGIESVVLQASEDGRGVYERLGFIATNEMRLRKGEADSD
jgi:hypothetical protein